MNVTDICVKVKMNVDKNVIDSVNNQNHDKRIIIKILSLPIYCKNHLIRAFVVVKIHISELICITLPSLQYT